MIEIGVRFVLGSQNRTWRDHQVLNLLLLKVIRIRRMKKRTMRVLRNFRVMVPVISWMRKRLEVVWVEMFRLSPLLFLYLLAQEVVPQVDVVKVVAGRVT